MILPSRRAAVCLVETGLQIPGARSYDFPATAYGSRAVYGLG